MSVGERKVLKSPIAIVLGLIWDDSFNSVCLMKLDASGFGMCVFRITMFSWRIYFVSPGLDWSMFFVRYSNSGTCLFSKSICLKHFSPSFFVSSCTCILWWGTSLGGKKMNVFWFLTWFTLYLLTGELRSLIIAVITKSYVFDSCHFIVFGFFPSFSLA